MPKPKAPAWGRYDTMAALRLAMPPHRATHQDIYDKALRCICRRVIVDNDPLTTLVSP